MYAVLLALLAVVLCLVALVLWWHAGRSRTRQLSRAVLEQQLARRMDVTQGVSHRPQAWQGGPKSWQERLLRAGLQPSKTVLMLWAGACLVPPLLLLLLIGPVAALAYLCASLLGSYVFICLRTDKRQRKAISQIPDFLDLIVRLITIGQSMGAAFLSAADQTTGPLGEVLQEAKSLHQSGQELDLVLRTVARRHGIHELFLVGSVVGVALRFGGRSDQTMERMAGFMRDRESARNELVAMSAEVRLSAWVLALLPAGIALYIMLFNNQLFLTMWLDPVGFRMLIGAMLLQLGGCYWLYRMARNV